MYKTLSGSSAGSLASSWTHTLPRASWTLPTGPFSAVPTAQVLYRPFPGLVMCLNFLTLCSFVASVDQLEFTLWVTSSGRPFLTPTSGLDPPLYDLTASCIYSLYSIYQPLFSHKSMYCSIRPQNLPSSLSDLQNLVWCLANGPSINICWNKC